MSTRSFDRGTIAVGRWSILYRSSNALFAFVLLCPVAITCQPVPSAEWLSIKRELIGVNGPEYFASTLKGASAPRLKGFFLSFLSPTGKAARSGLPGSLNTLVIAISDATTPEVTLRLTDENGKSASLRSEIKPGTGVTFEGVPVAFRQDPFMVTFDVRMDQVRFELPETDNLQRVRTDPIFDNPNALCSALEEVGFRTGPWAPMAVFQGAQGSLYTSYTCEFPAVERDGPLGKPLYFRVTGDGATHANSISIAVYVSSPEAGSHEKNQLLIALGSLFKTLNRSMPAGLSYAIERDLPFNSIQSYGAMAVSYPHRNATGKVQLIWFRLRERHY